MKAKVPYFAALAAMLLILLGFSSPSSGQADGADPAIVALIDDLTKQQASLVENQTKIDEKLALVAEDIRQARIFASRAR